MVALTVDGAETTGTPSTAQDGAAASSYIPVTFDNYISKWFFSESIFEPSLGETQRISATFAAYSTWTLEISDAFNTVVRTGSGEGYTMQFDWDGNGNGGAGLPDGEYGFLLTATETTAPAPPPGGGGGGGPPSPMMAAIAGGQTSYFVEPPPMPPVKKDSKWYSWEEIYGPLPAIEIKIPETSIQRFLATSLGVEDGGGVILNGGGGGGAGGGATQAPRRPPPKRIKGKPGVVGVAYQGHHPFTTNGIPGFTRPNNIVGLITLDPNFALPYGPIGRAREIADGFSGAMGRSSWKTAFNYGDDRITAPLLRKPSKGGSNLFNYCNIGLLVGHGIRGTTQDGVATSTPSLQTYMPIYQTGVNAYNWVRMSEFDFGGGPVGLRWMGIYACNMLFRDNALDMWNKGVLPMNQNLHILLSEETSVHMYPTFGRKWANYMNGKEAGGVQTIISAWNLASRDIHNEVRPSHPVIMSSAYWPNCINDKLLDYTPNDSDDPSEIGFRRVRVYPTFLVIE